MGKEEFEGVEVDKAHQLRRAINPPVIAVAAGIDSEEIARGWGFKYSRTKAER